MARILIVDDSRTARKILREILIAAGHNVVGEARDGEEGMKMYSELKPDLVTLDITMPIMDGLDTLKKIRELDSEAVVVMVTAAGQKNKMVEAVENGAEEFVMKPYKDEDIIAVINRILKIES